MNGSERISRRSLTRQPVPRLIDSEDGSLISEEIELLRDYKADISLFPTLNNAETKELSFIVRDPNNVGQPQQAEAIKAIVEGNLNLVLTPAYLLANSKFPLMDAIQEGNIGLLQAAKSFDPSYKNPNIQYENYNTFASYAIPCIWNEICRAMEKPINTVGTIHSVYSRYQYTYSKAKRLLALDLERDPLTSEIIDTMDKWQVKVESLDKARELSGDEVGLYHDVIEDPLSINPLKIVEELELCRLLYQPKKVISYLERSGVIFENPSEVEQQVTKMALKLSYSTNTFTPQMKRALSKVNPRHQEIVKLRYGQNLSYIKIGERMGHIKKQAVNQTIATVVRRVAAEIFLSSSAEKTASSKLNNPVSDDTI